MLVNNNVLLKNHTLLHDLRPSGLIRPHHAKLLALVRILDSAIILSSLYLTILLLDHFLGQKFTLNKDYIPYALGGLLFYQFFAEYYEVYDTWRGAPIYMELLRIFWSWTSAILILIVIGFFTESLMDISRQVMGFWFATSSALLVASHGIGRYYLSYFRSHGRNSRLVAVVGANELGQRLSSAFSSMPWLGYLFHGYYDDRIFDKERRLSGEGTIIRGTFNDLINHAREGLIDEIFITLPMQSEKRVQRLITLLSDTTANVYYVPNLFVFNLVHSRWMTFQGVPCVSVYSSPFNNQLLDSAAKRLEDIALSSIILILLCIPMLIIAIVIKLGSPGPVIFKQKRYGIRGEPIEVWKFRTMTVCDNGDTVHQAKRGDPRITPFGSFLRKTSLDELPQFINVLQGQMSIVGPRPHAIAHNEYYRKIVHGYMLRHKVKPGITGLAQINGYRGETDTLDKMERRVDFDLEYIHNWRLFLDFKIILLTAIRVLNDRNAY